MKKNHARRSSNPLAARSGASLTIAAIALLAGCTPNVTERDLEPARRADLLAAAQQPTAATIIIDARTPSKYKAGHIPAAINLNIADINTESRKRRDLAAADRIIVYGQNPGDSLAAGLALRLLEAGYDQTRIYRQGLDAWTADGGRLATGTP